MPWNTVLLQKVIVAQVGKFSASGFHPEPVECRSDPHIWFLRFVLILSSQPHQGLSFIFFEFDFVYIECPHFFIIQGFFLHKYENS
jgi:hypothetical protein